MVLFKTYVKCICTFIMYFNIHSNAFVMLDSRGCSSLLVERRIQMQWNFDSLAKKPAEDGYFLLEWRRRYINFTFTLPNFGSTSVYKIIDRYCYNLTFTVCEAKRFSISFTVIFYCQLILYFVATKHCHNYIEYNLY